MSLFFLIPLSLQLLRWQRQLFPSMPAAAQRGHLPLSRQCWCLVWGGEESVREVGRASQLHIACCFFILFTRLLLESSIYHNLFFRCYCLFFCGVCFVVYPSFLWCYISGPQMRRSSSSFFIMKLEVVSVCKCIKPSQCKKVKGQL